MKSGFKVSPAVAAGEPNRYPFEHMTSRQLNFTLSAALLLGAVAFILHATFGRSEHLSSNQLIGEWEGDLPKNAKDQYSTRLSILPDGTFIKTEKKGGPFLKPRTTVFKGEYKIGSDGLYGEYVHFFVFTASSPDDDDVSKKYAESGGWNFMCKYGLTSDGRLVLMDIFGNKSGLKKLTDDIFPSWEFYTREDSQ